jgi:putative oxidoreductase
MATVMLNAIESVHWKNGFFAGKGGYEFNLQLLAIAVAIAMTGPGRFSLDHALGWDDNISGLWWGVGVFGAAVAVSVVTTKVLRRRTQAG